MSASAAALRTNRQALSLKLAGLVSAWPKFAEAYAADPEGFARLETDALVDYMAEYLATGDATYRHLYIGEKAKQFFDPPADEASRNEREKDLLAAEHKLFREATGGAPRIEETFAIIEQALLAKAQTEIGILFVGDCLYLDVMSFLIAPALEDGIRIRPTYVVSHDAMEQRAQLAKLSDEKFDLIFYSPLSYALDKGYETLQTMKGALNRAGVKAAIQTMRETTRLTFDTVADLFEAPIFVHAPAPVQRHEGTPRDRLRLFVTAPAMRDAARAVSDTVRDLVAARNAKGHGNIHIVDEAALIAPVGLTRAGAYFYKSTLQHPALFGALVAQHYRDIIYVAARLQKRKLVVCDLDNTLWEGVIGEGLGVRHHADRQEVLLRLKARGVVLAINSKNDPTKVHWTDPGAKLTADDFVHAQINWDPKPLNIKRIAQHLELKEKDFVFVDDRADERAMVAEQFPALLTSDALDPRTWRLYGLWADMIAGAEGSDRTELYRQRDERKAFLAAEEQDNAAERAETFAQLGLTLDIREAGADDLTRVTELINRTNQFNMTGTRITARETAALAASPDARILVADAGDRFGSMGTIAILIAERGPEGVTIPYYVLSCRVFGYGMEFAILEQARNLAAPGEALIGPFTETQFNQPCRDVYRDAGFAAVAGGWRMDDAAAKVIAVPEWLTQTVEVAAFSLEKADRAA
jgi:FkbH-like protein